MFDLFGTLIDNFEGTSYEVVYHQLADLLGLDRAGLAKAWRAEPVRTLRMSGQYDTFEACLRDVCQGMGVTYDPRMIPRAIELRMQATRANMVARPDAVAVLQTIRRMGLKIGLVSDCTWEVPQCWPEMPLAPLVDEVIFSCTAKLKKPDPRIYSLICERLAVRPGECLYIGDCGCDELEGAVRAGMDAALICVPYEEDVVMSRVEAKRWRGPRISSVSGVLDLLNGNAKGEER